MTSKKISSQEIKAWSRRIAALGKEAAKAEGAVEQFTKQLLEEFECGSIEEAEQLLEELESQKQKQEQRVSSLKSKFEKKWKDVLQSDDADEDNPRAKKLTQRRRKTTED